MTPIDHRSTGLPCPLWLSISGATYPKLPATVVSCSPEDSRCFAMPKSAMTISEDGSLVRNRMFSGFRSRWTMSWSCRYLTPDSTDLKAETEDTWLRGDVYVYMVA